MAGPFPVQLPACGPFSPHAVSGPPWIAPQFCLTLILGFLKTPFSAVLLFNIKEEPEFAKAPHGCCHMLVICQGIREVLLLPQPPNLVSLNFSSFLPGSATITQRKAFQSVKRCQLLLPSFDTLLPASNLSDTSSHNLRS